MCYSCNGSLTLYDMCNNFFAFFLVFGLSKVLNEAIERSYSNQTAVVCE